MSTSCYRNRLETINSSDQTPHCASAEASRQMPVDDSVVTKIDKTWCPPWAKSIEQMWKEQLAEASVPKVHQAAQHTQSQEIEAATDSINPVKQQKKVKSPYYKLSVHTGCYEPQWSEGAVFRSAHGPHLQAKSDNVQHSEQGLIFHFGMPAAGGELVAHYTDSARSVTTSEDVNARRCQTGDNSLLNATKLQACTVKHEDKRAWNQTNLTVLCTEGKCQVNMGNILVLFTAPTWGSIKHVAAALSRLGKQKQNQFLNEAHQHFQAQMSKCTISNSWGFSAETVRQFTDVMKEA